MTAGRWWSNVAPRSHASAGSARATWSTARSTDAAPGNATGTLRACRPAALPPAPLAPRFRIRWAPALPDVAGLVRTMPHAARAVSIQQDGLDLAAGLDFAAGFANDGHQPVAEHLRAAADIVAAAGEIRHLRHGEMGEGHRIGIVGIVSKVRRHRELDRFVVAEQPSENLAERCAAVADQRPQPPGQGRCVPEPPAAIILMLAHHRDRLANRIDALEILLNAPGLLRKLRLAGTARGIEPVRHHERLFEQRASHLMQVADIDERNIAIDAQRAQDRRLGIAGVETVDLVQRRLDRKRAVMIDRRGPAKTLDMRSSPCAASIA